MVRKPPPDSDLQERRELLDAAGIKRTLRRMAHEIAERIPQGERPLYLVGVRTGGAYLAHRLCDELVAAGEAKPVLGAVDISLYRDDVFHGLPKPEIGPTELPAPIEGRVIVLVDDVLFTGRTIRAAMDVLADYGRPRAVTAQRWAVLEPLFGRARQAHADGKWRFVVDQQVGSGGEV